MSRRKKLSHAQKVRARMERQQEREYGDGPPSKAVAAYVDAFEWAAEHPELAAEVAAWDQDHVQNLVIGIAFSERFGYPEDQAVAIAGRIKTWHILNGFKYFYDWWNVPIAQMTPEEIVAQIRLDRDNSKVVILDDR